MSRTPTRWISRLLDSLRGGGERPAPALDVPSPLTAARVGDDLTRRGYHYRSGDGELTGTWDGHRMWFLLLGERQEILCVRGRWSRTLPGEHRGLVLRAINDWNRDAVWPTAYVREDTDDGVLSLYAEISVDLEHGVTDAQLADVVTTGLSSAIGLFRSVDRLLGPLPTD
ncbi:putative sensory transduction regulator [Sediminihabitans luteus]|uniref:Putative sensory transduction regulator n=1 Tax=Sediminihabitans luteus TaxID=1138585 RepID=A0A2M9CCG7_9CELL|nr:YbjN domain-containing protein [Sediminihabitans luteus]PJJ69048.1 putative sensory transduction regulator [Sediminihabitans luteus]GII99434.1 hypothetical protein Slu03_18120 [Sediminihabitans luteus]